jgi:hypothetical protein
LYPVKEAEKAQGNEFEMRWCEALPVVVHILHERSGFHVEGYHIARVHLGRYHCTPFSLNIR